MLKRHLIPAALAISLVAASCSASDAAVVSEDAAQAPDTTGVAADVEQTNDSGGILMVQDGDLVEVHY